jgi:hypothetical protein
MALVQSIETAASAISSVIPRLLTCPIVYSLPKTIQPGPRPAARGSLRKKRQTVDRPRVAGHSPAFAFKIAANI